MAFDIEPVRTAVDVGSKALAAAKTLKEMVGGAWAWARRGRMERADLSAARGSLAIVQCTTGGSRSRWHEGSKNKEPAMQLVGHFNVTNRGEQPVTLLRAEIKRADGSAFCEAGILVSDPFGERREFSRYEIPPGAMVEASFCAFGQPVLGVQGQAFQAEVVFVDSLECEHVRPARFKPT